MNIRLDKNTSFSALLTIIVLTIIYRIIPVTVDPVVALTISKNKDNISNIHQKRNIEKSQTVYVEYIDLFHKNRFSHKKLGNIANNTSNFFVDIKKRFRVKESGDYRFIVGSDDGFWLKIDGKPLCEHQGGRPYAKNTCEVSLTLGSHLLEFSYYQGYGNAGLTIEYTKSNSKKHWFGENSKYIEFKREK